MDIDIYPCLDLSEYMFVKLAPALNQLDSACQAIFSGPS